MKTTIPRNTAAFSAVAAAALLSLSTPGAVDAAVWEEYGVECLENAPLVCIGKTTLWTPSPTLLCPEDLDATCAPGYAGGWGWHSEFVTGLDEGTEDPEAIEDARIGLDVTVTIDDDETTCRVEIQKQGFEIAACDFCTTEGCDYQMIRYDCTNLAKGRSSFDECIDPSFVSPFKSLGRTTDQKGATTPGNNEPQYKALRGSSVPTTTNADQPQKQQRHSQHWGPYYYPKSAKSTKNYHHHYDSKSSKNHYHHYDSKSSKNYYRTTEFVPTTTTNADQPQKQQRHSQHWGPYYYPKSAKSSKHFYHHYDSKSSKKHYH